MRAPLCKFAPVVLLLASVSACSNRGDAEVARARGTVVDSSAGTVALGLRSVSRYRASTPGSGAIAGTITLQGERRDSVVPVTLDQKTCGDSASVTETQVSGNTPAGAHARLGGS